MSPALFWTLKIQKKVLTEFTTWWEVQSKLLCASNVGERKGPGGGGHKGSMLSLPTMGDAEQGGVVKQGSENLPEGHVVSGPPGRDELKHLEDGYAGLCG